jgi:hypothetical protein
MKHSDGLTVQGFNPVAEQALVLPDRLKQALGRRVPVFVQNRDDTVAHAPVGIEAGQDWKHRAKVLRLTGGKSSLSQWRTWLLRKGRVPRLQTLHFFIGRELPELVRLGLGTDS